MARAVTGQRWGTFAASRKLCPGWFWNRPPLSGRVRKTDVSTVSWRVHFIPTSGRGSVINNYEGSSGLGMKMRTEQGAAVL